MHFRTEKDSLGEIRVPQQALYGAQTQRAIENFQISAQPMPQGFIACLLIVKKACALANREAEVLSAEKCEAIVAAIDNLSPEQADQAFPVDRYQTGSGTSTNMNVNEVVAQLASQRAAMPIHPNDDVNASQSSNDVIPTTIHLAAATELRSTLFPGLSALIGALAALEHRSATLIKTGRTHLMDAMPLSVAQEFSAFRCTFEAHQQRLERLSKDLCQLAIGGSAVGTGINTPDGFGAAVCGHLAKLLSLPLTQNPNLFRALSSQDTVASLSGELKSLASSLMKLSNDLRWSSSGPLSGIAELTLPVLQPGSSIMPGKVNPVVPEATAMVAARVIGNDCTLTIAAQSGNFQLNVMLPLIAATLLESITLSGNAMRLLAEKTLDGLTINSDKMHATLSRNPILVTALNPIIGYDRAASIAKKAYQEQRSILEVALENTELSRDQLERLLDPARLAYPHSADSDY